MRRACSFAASRGRRARFQEGQTRPRPPNRMAFARILSSPNQGRRFRAYPWSAPPLKAEVTGDVAAGLSRALFGLSRASIPMANAGKRAQAVPQVVAPEADI